MKLKVYCVVLSEGYGHKDVLRIFALQQEAQEEADTLNKAKRCDSYEVEEWEVE